MDDVLILQVVECQCHLAEVEFDSVLAELDTLLQVVAQISSQQEVHDHKHVLLVLERVPATREGEGTAFTRRPGLAKETHAIKTQNNKHIAACTLHVQSVHVKHPHVY